MKKVDFWDIPALGELPTNERGEFYDAIAEDEEKKGTAAFFGGSDSSFFENPTLRVGILEPDGSIISATGYARGKSIQKKKIRLYLQMEF